MARRGRRTSIGVAGATEAARLAMTLGDHARTARRVRHQPLRAVAKQVGISASRLSEIERGDGAGTPLETWVGLGMALGRPVAMTFSRAIDEPRSSVDTGHLEIQEHILALARATGRTGSFELPTRPTDPSRSTDVGLRDLGSHARIHVECWNTFGDLWSGRARDEPEGRRGDCDVAG
jgi:transcriptional regulator with XRE-family HTH domain